MLTLLAFLLRGLAVGAIPHNVHGDEGEMGLVARAVIRGEFRNPFATAFLTHSTLWFFIQALSLSLFGDSMDGLRMLSALLGTLAIPALYVFARPLYGRSVAMIAAALLAAYHFHVHYSRIGLNNIADATMMVLTLAAFFYGYNKRSSLGFALAGVFMGLAQYFYFSARLIPIVVLALLAYLVIRERRQLLESAGKLGVMLVGFILSGGPLFRYYLMHPDTFSGRVMEHGLLQNGNFVKLQVDGQGLFAALANHAYRTFGFLVALNENNPFYDPGIPLLDHGMDLLFILGLVLALVGWRKIECIVLLLWIGGTALFGGFLLWDDPQSPRYVIAAPALCVLMSLALVQIGSLLSQTVAMPQRLSYGIITVFVLAIMSWNVYFYFGTYTRRNSYASAQAVTEIAYYLRPQAGDRYVYMFTSPYFYLNHGTIKFVGNEPKGIDIVEPLTSISAMPAPPPELRPLFIFVPDRLSELEIIKQQYPHGELHEYRALPSNDRTIMYIYEPGNSE
jgi:4-amino-4-deoxy-L-arabinose transferase-like glycosyltransferase